MSRRATGVAMGNPQADSAGMDKDIFTTICKACIGVDVVREYRFHPKRKWRFDYAAVQHKVALEVEGGVWTQGRHTRPKGFLNDIEKYNTATLLGWRVLRVTPTYLFRMETINLLKSAIGNSQWDKRT